MPASVSIQTLWADTFLHWIPSVPDTDISCDIGPQKLSFEPHWAWVVLEHEPLRSSSSLRSRRVTGKVSVPKRGAKCSSVAMYLYMISSVHRLPRSTVCCWKDRTKSLNTRWILSLVRKLSLEMCLAKDLGTQSRKLKKNKRYSDIIWTYWLDWIKKTFVTVAENNINSTRYKHIISHLRMKA